MTLAAQAKATAPTIDVDPLWPKPFPQKKAWILGSVTGVAVDGQDHIWVVHRGVDSLQTNEKGPALEPWASSCCFAAPQILEFDAAGKLLANWEPKTGRASTGRTIRRASPSTKGNVWVGSGLPALVAGAAGAGADRAPAGGAARRAGRARPRRRAPPDAARRRRPRRRRPTRRC